MWFTCFLCEEWLHNEKDNLSKLIMGEVMNSDMCKIRRGSVIFHLWVSCIPIVC